MRNDHNIEEHGKQKKEKLNEISKHGNKRETTRRTYKDDTKRETSLLDKDMKHEKRNKKTTRRNNHYQQTWEAKL